MLDAGRGWEPTRMWRPDIGEGGTRRGDAYECSHGSPPGHRLHLKGAAPQEAGLVLQLWTHKEGLRKE